jgi:transcriptional regulator with XRE-family HTH domain
LTELDTTHFPNKGLTFVINTAVLKNSMQQLGLNQSDLAVECGVTREAVSQWMLGKAIPRPTKLKLLLGLLGVAVDDLLLVRARPLGIAVSSEMQAVPLTDDEQTALQETGSRLRELEPYMHTSALFEPVALIAPCLDEDYLRAAVAHVKQSINVGPESTLSTSDLVVLTRNAGTLLLPTPWMGNRPGQRHILKIESEYKNALWLVFGGSTRQIDFDATLTHALGVQYVRNSLKGADAEEFARKFAQVLGTPGVYRHANPDRMYEQVFGISTDLSPSDFVTQCEKQYCTPVYRALAAFQRDNGGRDPAFIASLLNISLGPAVALSCALWK